MIFMPQLLPTADIVTVLPVFDCPTAQISMRPTCAIRMGISYPLFAAVLQKDNEELVVCTSRYLPVVTGRFGSILHLRGYQVNQHG